MMMGPEPMMTILRMSVRLGMRLRRLPAPGRTKPDKRVGWSKRVVQLRELDRTVFLTTQAAAATTPLPKPAFPLQTQLPSSRRGLPGAKWDAADLLAEIFYLSIALYNDGVARVSLEELGRAALQVNRVSHNVSDLSCRLPPLTATDNPLLSPRRISHVLHRNPLHVGHRDGNGGL